MKSAIAFVKPHVYLSLLILAFGRAKERKIIHCDTFSV